jgi:hypothetical protein
MAEGAQRKGFSMSKTVVVLISLLLAFGCAGRSTDDNPAPATPATATQNDGFTYWRTIGNFGPGSCVKSTRPDLVMLKGVTCTDDGVECFDMGENTADIYYRPEAQAGTPEGPATYVQNLDSCD